MATKVYDSDINSVQILETITKGIDFSVPDVDFNDGSFDLTPDILKLLKDPMEKLTVETITVRQVDGSGIFDGFMKAFSVHILDEYKNKRITGAEYVKAYIALSSVAMQCAVTYALGKDKAFWDALRAQIDAINANINNAMAKVQLAIAKAQAHQNKANYALTVDKLAMQDAQFQLIKEQMESARADTSDSRNDGGRVAGVKGKQKELYDQQIWAYEKDAETKVAQIYSNAWITQKGIDEALAAPGAFQNSTVDNVIGSLRRSVGL